MTKAPRAIAHYDLDRQLGRGGMGVVWLARHRKSGEQVALKTVRAAHVRQLTGLRREIHALSRVRHPGVVRIVDHGVDDGLPWYAMQLVQGATLVEHVHGRSIRRREESTWANTESSFRTLDDSSGEHTDPLAETIAFDAAAEAQSNQPVRITHQVELPREVLERLVEVICRLCDTLSFLHGEGFVHRDLKPDNVIVRAGGRPVLVDFGLSTQFGGGASREHLTVQRGIVGTAAYIAPEQLRDELVDARADLYSLGCILYELVSGRAPFSSPESNASEIIRAHLENDPPPLGAVVRNVPEPLEKLVHALLAKSPRARIGYAADVKAALASVVGGSPPSLGPRAKPYLYRPGFAGRRAIVEQMLGLLERALAAEGSLVLLGGESGMGKTRLLSEVGRDASRRGGLVLSGDCAPPSGEHGQGVALGALLRPLQALADRWATRELPPPDDDLRSELAILGIYEPALALLADRPPPRVGDIHRRVIEALSAVLFRVAEVQPVLLVLDDLMWADEVTMGWLEALASDERLPSAPLLVIGSYRIDEANARLASLASRARGVELDKLGEAEVSAIVTDMLALESDQVPFAGFLTRRSRGNPFFVAEYLRTAVQEGLLVRDLAGRWQLRDPDDSEQSFDALPLPTGIQDLVLRRLEALTGGARRLARGAAVLGRRFDPHSLGVVSGVDGNALLEGIDQLLTRHVLQELEPGYLGFVHDKVREAVYAAIGLAERTRLHLLAGRALQRQEPATVGELSTIADHYERGAAPRQAVQARLAAANLAEKRGALPEAIGESRAAAALAEQLADNAPERLEARVRLGGLLATSGQLEEAADQLDVAVEQAQAAGDADAEARAHAHKSYVSYLRGNADATLSHAERAAELARDTDDQHLASRIQNALGIAWGTRGHYRRAIAHYTRAAELAQAVSDFTSASKHLGNISINHRLLGQLELARDFARRSLDGARQAGMVALEANAWSNLGRVELERSDSEEASRAFRRAIELAGPIEMTFVVVESEYGLAQARLDEGDLEAARHHAERSLALAKKHGYSVSVGAGLRIFALLAARQERDARELFEQSISVLRETGEKDELGDSLMAYGVYLEEKGDVHQAAQRLDEARQLFESLGMQARLDALDARG